MQRLLIVYNPSSSRFADVKKAVLTPAQNLKGCLIGKYEVEKTNLDSNITKLSKLIQDGDLVTVSSNLAKMPSWQYSHTATSTTFPILSARVN